MDIHKLKWTLTCAWTQLQAKIFSLLCLRAGERLSQREISKILGVSPTAIANSLEKLKEINLVKVEKTKTINFVSFNRDEKKSLELKRVENIRNIYMSGLMDYLEPQLAGATIILFGSYSLGEDTVNSDVDVAVIGRKEKALDTGQFEKILNRNINVNFYESWGKIHRHLKNNLLNGIVFAGGVEL